MKRFGWSVLTVCFAVAVGLAISHEPWQEYQKMRQESHNTVEEARKIERERAALLHENARLDSPAGMEEIARERGYRPADEKPLELGE